MFSNIMFAKKVYLDLSTLFNIFSFKKYFCVNIIFVSLFQVHIFGASLGGFLAQKFAEFTCKSPRVASIILCNSFYDTSIFHQTNSATTYV